MKMVILPDEMYILSLASCDFEELSFVLEERLRAAGATSLPTTMRKNVGALATKIWNLEVEPGPGRDRRIQQVRRLVAKCGANLDAGALQVPSAAELCQVAKTLLVKIELELDGLELSEFRDRRAGVRRRWIN